MNISCSSTHLICVESPAGRIFRVPKGDSLGLVDFVVAFLSDLSCVDGFCRKEDVKGGTGLLNGKMGKGESKTSHEWRRMTMEQRYCESHEVPGYNGCFTRRLRFSLFSYFDAIMRAGTER